MGWTEALPDEEIEVEKSYVDYYKNTETPNPLEHVKKICSSLVSFVCSESVERQLLTICSDTKTKSGWNTEPQTVLAALTTQFRRAKERLSSLTQMYDLLLKCQNDPYLYCINQNLIAGYFNFCGIKNEQFCNQLHHYLEGIQAAPKNLQQEIVSAVHNIYKLLASSLKKCGPQNKQLQLLIIFALSARHRPDDIDLLVKNELTVTLTSIYSSQVIVDRSITNNQVAAVASLRLMHIIAMFTSMFAKSIDITTTEKVVDKLYEQLLSIIENTSGCEQSVADRILGDYLVFLRTVAGGSVVQKLLASNRWIVALLSIAKIKSEASNYIIQMYGLRPKLLVLQLLQKVLTNLKPSNVDKELIQHVINEVFELIAEEMWTIPFISSKVTDLNVEESPEGALETDDCVPIHDMGFDPDKCFNCTIEGNLTLMHGVGGRGYGLGTKPIRSGCYQWKILIVKENKGNEGTCIGVSKYPVKDYSHRTTNDMWLYRAYSGSLYHSGERDSIFPTFSQGDYITVVLDMDARTLSFGKNGGEPRVAFENIDATELYPCITFYSTNPGEKVKITDMKVRVYNLLSLCRIIICLIKGI